MFQQLFGAAVPAKLCGPLLVDDIGLPRFWTAVWSVISSAQLADSTHTRKLRYVEDLYQHADNLRGPNALDNALTELDDGLSVRALTIIRERYPDFGPTLTREKLEECHGIRLEQPVKAGLLRAYTERGRRDI